MLKLAALWHGTFCSPNSGSTHFSALEGRPNHWTTRSPSSSSSLPSSFLFCNKKLLQKQSSNPFYLVNIKTIPFPQALAPLHPCPCRGSVPLPTPLPGVDNHSVRAETEMSLPPLAVPRCEWCGLCSGIRGNDGHPGASCPQVPPNPSLLIRLIQVVMKSCQFHLCSPRAHSLCNLCPVSTPCLPSSTMALFLPLCPGPWLARAPIPQG